MPPNFFSVVQYVPNPTTDERVNLGLIVLSADGRGSIAKFDEAMRRARRIAPPDADLSFLAEVQRELEARLPASGHRRRAVANALDIQGLRRLQRDAGNVIQFTEPRASSAPVRELADHLLSLYLPPLTRRTRARGDRAVRRTVQRAFEVSGLVDRVKTNSAVTGRHGEYIFDFVFVNGGPTHVVEALSFDKRDPQEVRSELYATAYCFEDVIASKRSNRPALVVGASEPTDLLETARSIISDIAAEFVLEDHAFSWAERLAEEAGANRAVGATF